MHKVNRKLLRAGGSAGTLYAVSIGVLFLGELFAASKVSHEEFGSYQLVRNSLPVVTGIGLLGYDQVLVRELVKGGVGRARVALDQLGVISTCVLGSVGLSVYMWLTLGFDWDILLLLPVAAYLVSYALIVGSTMRASASFLGAAFAHQGYRLIAGVLLVGLSVLPRPGVSLYAVLALAAVAPFAYTVFWQRSPDGQPIPRDLHRRARSLGLVFSISTLTLAAMDWIDQFVIASSPLGLIGNGQYALVKLLTVYPQLSIASVVSFVALSEVARNSSAITDVAFRRWLARLTPLILLLSLAVWLVAREFAMRGFRLSIPDGVLLLLSLTGGLRLLYVLPSSVVGALGSVKHITVFGLLGFLALLLQTYISLFAFGRVTFHSVALGLLASVLVRTTLGITLSIIILRTRRD